VTWADWLLAATVVASVAGVVVLRWIDCANRVIDRAKADETMRRDGW
jgi:hypothetical protein